MKITITTKSDNPYAIHFTAIAEQIKRGLATFRRRKPEGDKVVVEDRNLGITVSVEEGIDKRG